MPQNNLATLSEYDEAKIQRNVEQLAFVHGNLIGTSRDARIIYVTSCHVGEGKTTSAIQMVHGLSINRCRVLLIDANPRSPILHEKYGSKISPGFLDGVNGISSELSELVRETKYPNLYVMPFGLKTEGRPELIRTKIVNFLAKLRSEFDYVILDGHAMTGSDTIMVAMCCDGAVMTIQSAVTKWEIVKQYKEKLAIMGVPTLGAVLNKRKYYIPKMFYL
jgi:Mrp family chromosome partitioning ATPase